MRVLLLPDYFEWVLGTIAHNIVRHNPGHDFFYLTKKMALCNPGLLEDAVSQVDVVHILCELVGEEQRIAESIAGNATLAISLHHIVNWDEVSRPFDYADMIHVASSEWRNFLVARMFDPARIIQIPYGVDMKSYGRICDRLAARRILDIPKDRFAVGYFAKAASNPGDRKGTDILLATIGVIADAGLKLSIVVTGPGWDKLVAGIRAKGIHIVYLPYASSRMMLTAYAALDAYVITSRIEGGPVTLLEAMASGIPVVTTPIGIARDIIHDGENGLLIPKEDVHAAADALMSLAGDANLRQSIAAKGRDTVKSGFSWDKIAPQFSKFYDHAFESGKVRLGGNRSTIETGPTVEWRGRRITAERQRRAVMRASKHEWAVMLAAGGQRMEAAISAFRGADGVEDHLDAAGVAGKLASDYILRRLPSIKSKRKSGI
ncbi:MAG TPA: glycosyltransferase family 4 protein [Candidatus Brocadiia bacterium]|nr:glycosyltransferase family 4 protein [Candidatus Brocadiia bacterium]